MKKCKIYSTTKKAEADAVIINGHVLLHVPLRDDMEPTYISDGQYYYPPLYTAVFAKGMNFDLMPFSVECQWGELSDEDSVIRGWFAYYSGDDYKIKCGYCDTKTGRICIPPEMEHCEDFNEYGIAIFGGSVETGYDSKIYKDISHDTINKRNRIRSGVYSGLMDTKGDIVSCRGYVGIEESHHGVFFGYQTADGWGVIDNKGCEIVEPLWHEISWDGMGGFTVMDHTRDGCNTYAIKNSDNYLGGSIVVSDLTEAPTTVYDFPPEKRRENLSLGECFESERFRLTQRGEKYGLVRDVVENNNNPLHTYTEEILDPIYNYEDIPDAAYRAWVDAEIYYYANLMSKTPHCIPGLVGDGWDGVPEDIRENVRAYMMVNGLEQPDKVEI